MKTSYMMTRIIGYCLLPMIAVQLLAFPSLAQEIRCPGPRVILGATPKAARKALSSTRFSINLQFDANVPPDFGTVVRQAAAEWSSILLTSGVNPETYDINVSLGAPPDPAAALATVYFNQDDGTLDRSDIVIRQRLGFPYTWYVDPTPADDVEFTGTPPSGIDLLSVVRHELGHAVGWIGTKRVTSLITGNVFDASRLNIGYLTNGDHADETVHPKELMVPSIGSSTRRSIGLYPTVALVARAFEYEIPMQFVDPAHSGSETGSAWKPWRILYYAEASTPVDWPILLAPVTHHVPPNTFLSRRHTWHSARGGATVINP
jgi:hypothetical protein